MHTLFDRTDEDVFCAILELIFLCFSFFFLLGGDVNNNKKKTENRIVVVVRMVCLEKHSFVMGLRKKKNPTPLFFFLLLIVWSASFALSCCGLFRCYCSLFDRMHDCLLFFFFEELAPARFFFFSRCFQASSRVVVVPPASFLTYLFPWHRSPLFHPLPLSFFIPFISRDCLAFFFFSFSHHM